MSFRTTTALLLACLLLLTTPSSIFGDESAAPTMTNEEAAASIANSAIGAVQATNKDGMPGPGERKVFGTDDEQIADMNLKLQEVFLEKLNELPEDKRADFIGKMHSPEMQDKIKKTFTSEAFQDHIDKMEAEKGIERPGNPYNELARKVKAEKEGKEYVPKKKGKKKKKKGKKGKKKKEGGEGGGDAESGGGGGGGGKSDEL